MSIVAAHRVYSDAVSSVKPLWWSLCAPRRTLRALVVRIERFAFGIKPNVTPLSYNWAHVRRLTRDLAELAPLVTGRLVDLGAGASPYHAILRRHASCYLAIDFPASLPRGETRAIRGLGGDLERMPLANESADSLVSLQVLPHVRRANVVAREMARVIRPGGRVIVTGSYAAPIQVEPYDFCRFTADGLAALLEDAGFIVEEKRTHGDLFTSLAITLSMSLQLTRRREGTAPRLSRPRQWLFAPLVLVLNTLSLLDDWLPFNRMPAGVLVVACKPDNSPAAARTGNLPQPPQAALGVDR